MFERLLSPKILLTIIGLLVIVGGGLAFKFIQKNLPSEPKNEAQQLVETVGKIADLPTEVPTIATVTDKEKLKQYAFFSKAEVGDKVLLYNQAKKAYLYRPSTGKLIEVGPIMLSDSSSEASSSATPQVAGEATTSAKTEKKYTLTLLNGTKTAGLATKTQTELENAGLPIEVKSKGNSKNDYPKTVVVAQTLDAKQIGAQIAKTLNATVSPLPDGELKPTTDLVIFLGEDRTEQK